MVRQSSRAYTLALTVLAISLCLPPHNTFAAQQQPGQNNFAYLPWVAKPINPVFTPLTFSSSLGCATNLADPQPSPATYDYGIRRLAVSTYITGATGATFTFTWTLNGSALPTLTDAGIVPLDNYTHTAIITFNANEPNCDPLPLGTYETQFYIANVLRQTATATVR
jgi:hypothetical protein